jgi:hypothetical protein
MEYDSTSEVHLRAYKISEFHSVVILCGCYITNIGLYADYKVTRNIPTVQFLYIETCGVRKRGKTKEKEGAVMRLVPVLWRETSVNTSSKYIGRKNSSSRHSQSRMNDEYFCTDGSRLVLYPLQVNTQPILPAFVKYLPSL